jgi:hypothetical protein
MSSISAGPHRAAAARTRELRGESWFAALGVKGPRAFRAAFAGYMLDAFDLIVLTLSLTAIGATFDVVTGATGALSTGIIGFLASAVGLGGAIAFGVFGYVLAITALTLLPETHGREIQAVE